MPLYDFPKELATLPAIQTLVEGLQSGRVLAEGLWGSSAALAALEFSNRTGRSLLILVPDPEVADEVEDDLTTWKANTILHYPAWDVLPSETEHVDLETLRERIQVLRGLATANQRGKPVVAVAPVIALMQPTIAPEDLRKGELALAPGDEMAPEALCGRLVDAGLERVAMVDAPGQLARRGGIVDAFPIFSEIPFRLDFFGDRIDSIQTFDVVSQRSEETVEECVLVDLSTHTVRKAYTERDKAATLAAHLPPDTAVFVIDPERCAERAHLYEEGYSIEHSALLSYQEACARLHAHALAVSMAMREEEWPEEWGEQANFTRVAFEISSITRLEGSTGHAIAEITKFLEHGAQVTVFCHNEAARSRCREVLLETGGNLAGQVELAIGRLSCGFHWPALSWTAIGDQEVFHRYHQRRRMRKRIAPGAPIRDLTRLRTGDYVVHAMHGVARYTGMSRLEHNGQENDYLTLLFDEDKRLYVPLSHIDLVQKYLGGREARPKLARLGGRSWKRKKAQAEKAVREVAADLLRIQAMRQHSPGISYSADNEWVKKFEDEFIYDETDDQLSAIECIKEDMEKSVPMDRLLCGDVGFGKTEVA
ncbi:MAG: hypothetical protein JXA52_08535, partial [Planctomycetes bacterium]|nr:hypothetical protein [Planctomycetota bacterium]